MSLSVLNELIKTFSKEPASQTLQGSSNIDRVVCICGKKLRRVHNPTTLYDGNNVVCDACRQVKKDEVIWHCDTINDEVHKGGFDICDACRQANTYDPIKFKEKAKQVMEDKKSKLLQALVSWGADEKLGSIALSKCNYDLNAAANWIIKYNHQQELQKLAKQQKTEKSCAIEKCEFMNVLNTLSHEVISNYNDQQNVLKILNSFHHLLFEHNMDDDEFAFIFKLFGGKCELENCEVIRRQYLFNQTDKNEEFVLQLFDRIHCHFRHSYDMFRLTNDEKKQVNEDVDEEKLDIAAGSNKKIILSQKIYNDKMSNFSKTQSRFTRNSNKFTSSLGQIRSKNEDKPVNSNDENKNEDIHSYSFSYNFVYWEQCKYSHGQQQSGYTLKDLYVIPKYSDLKDELLHNKICTFDIAFWKNKLWEAQCQQQSEVYKFLAPANVDQFVVDWKIRDDHPSKYGFNEGDCMNTGHLLVVIIYCSADVFQSKFSATYRKLEDDDNFEKIKARHSNFHHFAKHLKEVVEVFGTRYLDGNVERMYHGINKQMIFTSMQGHIHTVLSTTSSEGVAFQFASSEGEGLIVEMVPSAQLKYFNCCWLSKFSYEQELLFIGGWNTMNFVNIINVLGENFKIYTTCLRFIDNMMNGRYFEYDCTIWLQIQKQRTLYVPILLDTDKYDIPLKIKNIIIRLVQHECHRYLPNKYQAFPNLPQYIDRLLHHICLYKQTVIINWETMNSNVLTKYYQGGYIGCEFLKPYFCNEHYEAVNLDFITTLFPSAKQIFVNTLSSIDPLFLKDILEFIETNQNSKIIYLELRIAKKFGNANLKKIHDTYHEKFLNVGFDSSIFDNIPTQTKAYVIRTKKDRVDTSKWQQYK